MKLFVYGSLLSEHDHHEHLGASPMLGVCRTSPSYTLVDLGPYPALLEGGTTAVRGELYEVEAATLAALDEFEGHPWLYRRTRVRLEDGTNVEGYVLKR